MSGLAGRSVVLTRSRAQAAVMAEALVARDAIPLCFPTIEIRPLEDYRELDGALEDGARYDWIVFTSANAVSAVRERLQARGRTALAGSARIAAVGPATAAELARHGAAVSAMPAQFRGAAIAGALGDLRGARVLLPRADIGRDETVDALRAAGALVDDIAAYHTAPAVPDPDVIEALHGTVDAVTFTSPSTVRNFFALVGPDARRLLARTVVACIGPVTAATVTSFGLLPPLQAPRPTGDALIDLLDAYFVARDRPPRRRRTDRMEFPNA